MPEAIQVGGEWYIRADEHHVLSSTRALKSGDVFGVFDKSGDMLAHGGVHGLYAGGTRHLSHLELDVWRTRPLLLGSTVREGNDQLVVDLTNGDVDLGGGRSLRRESLHVFRTRFLSQGAWHERIEVACFDAEPVDLDLGLTFACDWADIFEVRGSPRWLRGEALRPAVEECAVELGYRGADGVERFTRLEFSERPTNLDAREARYRWRLEPGERRILYLRLSVGTGDRPVPMFPCDVARHSGMFDEGRRTLVDARAEICRVSSPVESFEHWLMRSVQDLQMLVTETRHGPYPFAGIPWYACVFGRDGLITAFQCLWWKPDIARGVLAYLAAEQATSYDPERDAEPGKVLHETRGGEMAATGEIPFGRYYGTVDATPLFVVLAGAYLQRTGDLQLARTLWPAVERALGWMERDGDPDGDGFLEYARKGAHGLANQGWKDSFDSVSHADGRLAEGPIALCEVQAYAYAAWREGARLAEALGYPEQARELRERSLVLASRFREAFWLAELGTYALALDGEKRPCAVRSSNVGHCLAFGIAERSHARSIASQLADPMFFTGWGVRTLASCERRYNPMSYHNGSVWPHDNALVAYGLGRYGHRQLAMQIAEGMLDASRYLDLNRLPELFCGFERREGRGPTLYPVSCAPQAWAAGAVFLLLQACLGIGVDGREQRIVLRNPVLPSQLPELRLERLRVGCAEVDLLLTRHDADNVSVQVSRRVGDCVVRLER